MPVEIRTSDGRHWARPALQHREAAPLVRFESRWERRRRVRAGWLHISIITLAAGALLAVSIF